MEMLAERGIFTRGQTQAVLGLASKPQKGESDDAQKIATS